ncbi:MAG: hypothetical protein ACYCU8_00920 [Ferrimicrobium acidiphilum]
MIRNLETILQELAELKTDWNSYGAPPIHPDAINQTRQLLENCCSIVPDTDGRVSVEFNTPDGDLIISIDNDGIAEIYCHFYDTEYFVMRDDSTTK